MMLKVIMVMEAVKVVDCNGEDRIDSNIKSTHHVL